MVDLFSLTLLLFFEFLLNSCQLCYEFIQIVAPALIEAIDKILLFLAHLHHMAILRLLNYLLFHLLLLLCQKDNPIPRLFGSLQIQFIYALLLI